MARVSKDRIQDAQVWCKWSQANLETRHCEWQKSKRGRTTQDQRSAKDSLCLQFSLERTCSNVRFDGTFGFDRNSGTFSLLLPLIRGSCCSRPLWCMCLYPSLFSEVQDTGQDISNTKGNRPGTAKEGRMRPTVDPVESGLQLCNSSCIRTTFPNVARPHHQIRSLANCFRFSRPRNWSLFNHWWAHHDQAAEQPTVCPASQIRKMIAVAGTA